MYQFIASAVLGFACTVYGTAFGLFALLGHHLFAGQGWLALGLLFVGLFFPMLGYFATTSEDPTLVIEE